MSFLIETRAGGGVLLRKVFEIIRELSPVMVLNVDAHKVGTRTMDESQVSLIDLHLDKGMFQGYTFDTERGQIKVGLEIGRAVRILKFAEAEDVVRIEYKRDSDQLFYSITNASTEKSCEFTSSILCVESYDFDLPGNIPLTTACVKLSSGEFARICKDLSTFGDHMEICFQNDRQGVVSCATNNEHGRASVILPCNCEKLSSVDLVRGVYGMRYLNTILKGSSLDAMARVDIDEDRPLAITFDVAEDSYLRFHLAPKILDDSEEENV